MQALRFRSSLAVLGSLLFTLTSAAAMPGDWQTPRFEIGAYGGVMDFDAARHLRGEVYGGRFGINLSPKIGIEGVVGTARAISSLEGYTNSRVWLSHADVIYHLLDGPFTPFISGGFGALGASSGTAIAAQEQMHVDVGGGIKLWMSDHLAVRGDLHSYWGRSDGLVGEENDLYGDVVATVGLVVGMGSTSTAPVDTDADGVADLDDRCANTPYGLRVDAFGCPPDTDHDGAPDYADDCPGTPLHAWVDDRGCPTDEDADGVADGLDRCLGTIAGATVDSRGCPRDTDADGVYDGIDLCAETAAGTEVDARGCPRVKAIERRMVLHNITFASGSADILPSSYAPLDEIARSLVSQPDVAMEVRGYADALGADTFNLGLTQRRAEAVRQYLIDQGVESTRLRARGYGESDPVAPNDTSEGRAMNRRVEFHRLD